MKCFYCKGNLTTKKTKKGTTTTCAKCGFSEFEPEVKNEVKE